ncbi:glycoside hydrolase domain-containing protein [Labedaea rhizosphaerae]|uniref:Rv2525c-like glycoside hydrolase-like domain-containing protein n=1 Tax=Labedaea rhizosphaerae TaxID=598644 RepID=A0A4R6SEX7_LABRH|nr:glycoside hydrolase domain-containing protein [Labedaea rhizosphaerae]TDP97636.1 hypothetical protein EV186_103600 [Labedaea rhizosphaerae]
MTALNLNGRRRWVDFRAVPKAGWDKLYAAFAADGVEGAIRYSGLGAESKQITSAERQAAAKHGVKLIVVGELGVDDAWKDANDYAAGQAAARTVLADVKREGFGSVAGCPAADAHATAAQVPQAVQYAKGFASVWGKALAGMYGFLEVLRACRAANAVTWHWLAGSMPSAEDARWLTFWQDNRGTRRYLDVEVDINWRLDGPLPGTEDELSKTAEDQIQSVYIGLFQGSHGTGWTAPPIAQTVGAMSKQLAALAALPGLVAQLVKDPNLDEATVTRIVDDAVAKHTPTAEENAAQMLPIIEQAVRAAVPAELADDVVARIGAALTATAPAGTGA